MSEIGEAAGLEVSRRGPIVDQAEQMSAPIGELIGLAVAILVLTLVFRSVAAMLLTLIASLIALAGGILLLQFGSAFTDFPSFAPTLGVMLGLGAGIDYALLIVGRYREQLASGDNVEPARGSPTPRRERASSRPARSSSSRSPACSRPGSRSSGRMGVGSAIVVAAVAVGAVTVLPTLMGAFARRLKPRNPKASCPRKAFERWAHADHGRPRTAAIAGTAILLALAAPVLGLRLGMPDDGNDASGTTTRVAYDRLAEGFGVGFNGPLVLATDRTGALEEVARRPPSAPPASRRSPSPSSPRSRTRRRSPSSPRPLPRTRRRASSSPGCATGSPRASTSAARRRCSTTWRPRSPTGCRSSSRS